MRHREVYVVGARAELGADLPVGRGHDAEQGASEDGDGEVAPVHGGLGLVQVYAHDMRDGCEGSGTTGLGCSRDGGADQGGQHPGPGRPRSCGFCKAVGSFRFARVGRVAGFQLRTLGDFASVGLRSELLLSPLPEKTVWRRRLANLLIGKKRCSLGWLRTFPIIGPTSSIRVVTPM